MSLTTIDAQTLPATLTATARRAGEYLVARRRPSTRRAYQSDLAGFRRWCEAHGLQTMPATPGTIGLFVTSLAERGRRPSTIQRKLVAIGVWHDEAGHPSPTKDEAVRRLIRGIRRTHGAEPRTKAPILAQDLRRMLRALPDGPIGARDAAVLLLGFAMFARRSELVALDVSDVTVCEDGLRVTIRQSKTSDTEQMVGVPHGSHRETCAVRALRRWLDLAGITEGAVFRRVDRHGNVHGRLSPGAVALIVKRAAERVGIDPATVAGHSLRSGGATSSALGGAPVHSIKAQGRWASSEMVDRYVRLRDCFDRNAAAFCGL